jgi:hypothetical protein
MAEISLDPTKNAADLPFLLTSVSTVIRQYRDFSSIEIVTYPIRLVTLNIQVGGLKASLASATFARIFAYTQNLANNDMNPTTDVNQIPPQSNSGAVDTIPLGTCLIKTDKSGDVDTVSLTLTANEIRLDYLDEYFSRTLSYLIAAIETDLNPG